MTYPGRSRNSDPAASTTTVEGVVPVAENDAVAERSWKAVPELDLVAPKGVLLGKTRRATQMKVVLQVQNFASVARTRHDDMAWKHSISSGRKR